MSLQGVIFKTRLLFLYVMYNRPLYYVAPRESLDFIKNQGILTPAEVIRSIELGELPDDVLGVSFGGIDSSNFKQFVSMVSDRNLTKIIAEQICFAKTGRYNDPDFMAIGYVISPEIRKQPGFLDESTVKQMNNDCYTSEVLFEGRIKTEFIHPRYFAVRTR
jgi:hypothetical protein